MYLSLNCYSFKILTEEQKTDPMKIFVPKISGTIEIVQSLEHHQKIKYEMGLLITDEYYVIKCFQVLHMLIIKIIQNQWKKIICLFSLFMWCPIWPDLEELRYCLS